MGEYLEAGRADEIEEGGIKAYNVHGKDLLVVRYDGKYFAMGRYCTHMGADLSRGKMEGKTIICPRHGSRFDVTTGEALSGPKIAFLKLKTKKEPSYPVKVENGTIKIKLP
jgi:3-phenylpropionate/trans-cinnamate dioxygenase ferredoxin subunit